MGMPGLTASALPQLSILSSLTLLDLSHTRFTETAKSRSRSLASVLFPDLRRLQVGACL